MSSFFPTIGSIGNFNNYMLGNEIEGVSSSPKSEGSVFGASMEVDGDMLLERVGSEFLCQSYTFFKKLWYLLV
jgi:hypothetical protein